MCARLAPTATPRYHPAVTDRREFLKRAALTAASAAHLDATAPRTQGAPSAPSSAVPVQPASTRALDAVLLTALGEAVLPESLGAVSRARAVAAFVRWLSLYAPVSEEIHGYGDAEITYTPSDPAPGWNAQLAGLDLLSRRKHRRGFARLSVPLRRAVLSAQLGRSGGSRLPSDPLAAPHVAFALMAHWAASSDAVDRAYEARIAKGNCRVLGETARQPLPLARGGDE